MDTVAKTDNIKTQENIKGQEAYGYIQNIFVTLLTKNN